MHISKSVSNTDSSFKWPILINRGFSLFIINILFSPIRHLIFSYLKFRKLIFSISANKFKNLSQKKIKFRQYYKKILDVFNNNLGFYVGCLMWAAYIKYQPEQNLLNNYCLGEKYDEATNTKETDFMIRFTELFPKDMKYFLGQIFEFEDDTFKYEFENSMLYIFKYQQYFYKFNPSIVNIDFSIPLNNVLSKNEIFDNKPKVVYCFVHFSQAISKN